MGDQTAGDAPVIVALPATIDMASVSVVRSRLAAAVILGAPVIVADLTATSFCDTAGVRCLLAVRDEAAAAGRQLRLVLRPGSLARRIMVLLEADHLLPVYSSVEEASELRAAARDPLSSRLVLVRGTTRP